VKGQICKLLSTQAQQSKKETGRHWLVKSGQLGAARGRQWQAISDFVVGQSHCGKARWRGRDWRLRDRGMVVGPS
jgi:hypothetical protein